MSKRFQRIATIVPMLVLCLVATTDLQAAPVSGSLSGFQSISRIRCRNVTLNKRVTVVPTMNGEWNCEQAGLVVNAGDVITVEIQETAQGLMPDRPAAVSALGSQYHVLLQWGQGVGTNLYSVYRALQPDVAPTAANKVADTETTFYLDGNVTPNVTYYYVVTATNDAGESRPSDPVTATTDAVVLDHTQFSMSCAQNGCHDGIGATGKGPTHIPTSEQCLLCHVTTAWLPARMDHTGVTGLCGTCHNGTNASGKPPGHFVVAQDCNACHITAAWLSVTYVHQTSNYPGNHRLYMPCATCHLNNSTAVAYTAPSFAPSCAGCHAATYIQSAIAHKNQPVAINQDCGRSGCHRVSSVAW